MTTPIDAPLQPDVFSPTCPTRRVIDSVADKWSVLVFLALRDRELRFNELRRKLQRISQKVLTQTLRKMEADGFIARTVFPTVPVTVEYRLTPLGLSLYGVIETLKDWAEAHAHELKPKPVQDDKIAAAG